MFRRTAVMFLAASLTAGGVVVGAPSATAAGGRQALDLQITYEGAAPAEARAAMDEVERRLGAFLGSDVPVRVQLTWTTDPNSPFAATAQPTAFPANFPNAPKPDVEYPIGLANALAGKDLAPGAFHVAATVNGTMPWDYRLSTTAADKNHFVGVMTHEMLHGLAFYGNAECNGTSCSMLSEDDRPVVFDLFVVDADGEQLAAMEEGSAEQYAAITSDAVFWNGPEGAKAAKSAASEPQRCGTKADKPCPSQPKLHFPTTYEQGSTGSHLDEVTYPYGTPNAMMSSGGPAGEVHNSPGPIAIGMVRDMGWPAPGSSAGSGGGYVDGDARTTQRIDQPTPTAAAVALSQELYEDGTVERATLSRDDKFADALAASALASAGPLFFTNKDRLDAAVRDELLRVLADDATVYIVGGPKAVSQAIEDEITDAGYKVMRLAGDSRFSTAVRIAREVLALNPGAKHVLVARGYGPAADPNGSAAWADAISAASYAANQRIPLVLVQTNEVPADVVEFLRSPEAEELAVVVLGGPGAVSEAVFTRLEADARVSGPSREATSIAIANQLYRVTPDGERTYVIVHGRNQLGWAWGLAAAGVAAQAGAPVLLVTDGVAPEVLAEVRGCGTHEVDLVVVGPTSVISEQVAAKLSAQDAQACG